MLEDLWEGLVGLIQVPSDAEERRHKVRLECRYPVVVTVQMEGRERSFRARVATWGW